MDWTAWAEICAAVLGVFASAAGTVLWFLYQSVRNEAREARTEASKIKDDLAAYKLHVAEHYVTQGELTKAVENLNRTLERILDAMNQNAQETRDGFTQLHKRIDGKADR